MTHAVAWIFSGSLSARSVLSRPIMKTSLVAFALSLTGLACGGTTLTQSTGSEPEVGAPAGNGNRASTDRAGADERPSATTSNPKPSTPAPDTAPDITGCSALTTASCGGQRGFSTSAELVAIIDALPWQEAHRGSSLAFTVSSDLVATADVTVSASIVAPTVSSANCPSFSGTSMCAPNVFRNGTYTGGEVSVPTIVCNGATTIPRGSADGCASLTIPKGTHFRMRKVVEDVHPYSPTYRPIIEVERPCNEPCRSDEARCGTSQTCFKKGEATCLFCHAQNVNVCACQDTCGKIADDTKCYYDTSPDTMQVGVCRSGTCLK